MTIITSEPAKERNRRSLARLLGKHFWPHRNWFIAGTLFAVLTSICAVGYGAVLGYVGNSIQCQIEGGTGDACDSVQNIAQSVGLTASSGWIWFGIYAIIALTAVRAISMYAMNMLNNTGVQRGLVSIQSVQFDALTDGDYARVAGDNSGGFVSRFINDVNAIRDAALRFANNFTKSLVTIIGVLVVLLIVDWQLAVIILVVYPLALGPVIALGNSIRARSKKAQHQIGEVTALVSEGLQSARVVKAYGLEDYQKERGKTGFAERSRLFLRVLSQRAAVDPVLEVVGGIAIAALLGFVSFRIAAGTNTLGDLLAIIALIGVASPEVRALGSITAVAQEGAAAADRVYEIIDAPAGVTDKPDARKITSATGKIAFEDVHFSYPDGTEALKGLSFSTRPGETVAIVGPSGAGKSTIFNLILRLYDATAGAVKVEGVDVRNLDSNSLRGATALVSQDTALFDDTIGSNIALGRLGADESEIEAAANAANAHDFILELPDGYASQAGEMGRNLSGGQRQRVALARAILRDAPILMLDEATSALDAESEAKVQAALAEFAANRTTLIIAHRLSTVRAADRIIVVDDGRIVETGSHDELMERNGVYRKLVELQLS
ncbi:MAG: ABC transporter ATP-binding protein/permease [Hyphomonas sp.]|nr:ABC transporter ATP-binding protein/permease [Hyphomonas sp.]